MRDTYTFGRRFTASPTSAEVKLWVGDAGCECIKKHPVLRPGALMEEIILS